MSLLILAAPSGTAISFVRPAMAAFGAAILTLRPLIGAGLIAALLWVFKPFLQGLIRAVYVAFKPRLSRKQRAQQRTLNGIIMLNRMARELDTQQPNLAAELRLLAARG